MACGSPGTGESQAVGTEERMPNIVLILADDLGYGDIQAQNPDGKIPTPHIDRMAREGMRFTDMHSNSAVCTPTRYGLLTGRYAWRTRLKQGVLGGYDPPLIDPKRLCLGEALQIAGYHTACIGKWHLGLTYALKDSTQPPIEEDGWSDIRETNIDFSQALLDGPNDHGFHYSYIIPSSLDIPPYFFIEDKKILGLPETYTMGKSQEQDGRGVFWRPGIAGKDFDFEEVLDHLGEKAVSYLEERANSADPFFLYFPLTAPHTPWLPASRVEGQSGAGRYGDFVVQVDQVVGKVLQVLDSLGLADETLVIVTSDNGADWRPSDQKAFPHLANDRFRGRKADIWEAGHRVPFFIRWPGKIAAGSKNDQMACLTDVYATLLAANDLPLVEGMAEDSYNLLPSLLDTAYSKPIRPFLVNHSLGGHFAVRKGPWKYIPLRGSGGFSEPRTYEAQPGEPKGQLYNLEQDIEEKHNLYLENPGRVAEMEKLLLHLTGK